MSDEDTGEYSDSDYDIDDTLVRNRSTFMSFQTHCMAVAYIVVYVKLC